MVNSPPRIVFSDIDGTTMHEPKEGDQKDATLLLTPPSASGRQDSVRQAAEARPEHFVVAKPAVQGTVAGTEEMLNAVLQHYGLQ
ncbi:hypothetical protein TSOC_003192 [Tetrabaena socialis]|uniref:Uncharacterized protein n=1 Tax=Tetrabaena socialis TaxID=47790 RepID=A0A2J8AC60_9CHLO|nr:hypothetical protein TSOC_003192 [Tetrabaena socialis]|eukprot:PNH10109.1 hypothetical protein TSOC_003192 [Tetrabaena socialis]